MQLVTEQLTFDAGSRSHIRFLYFVSWCKGCHWGWNRGDWKSNCISRFAEEESGDDTPVISGVSGRWLDPCDSAAWCWKVSLLLLFVFISWRYSYSIRIELSFCVLWSLIVQVCCWCICNFLYRKVGSGASQRSHAKLLLGFSSQHQQCFIGELFFGCLFN